MGFTSLMFAFGTQAATLFSDDFEEGNLEKWEVVAGDWEIGEDDGNHFAVTKAAAEDELFRAVNVAGSQFTDFRMEARIWQVSRDHGANIYYHNDHTAETLNEPSGWWYGISGALDAVGWGWFDKGDQTVWDVLFSPIELGWVKLRLEVNGKSAVMSILREGVDNEYMTVFEPEDIAAEAGMNFARGFVGLIVAGDEVRIDDVVITGDTVATAIAPSGKAAATWGRLKGVR